MPIILFLFVLFSLGCKSISDPNNKPLDLNSLRADVSVVGRTSTLKHIDIAYLGKTIPKTYSDGKIGNSRGYNWWASKHFALKSDLSEDKVRLYLELLEMSYPHYVELFGMEPKNIAQQRIAVVYGSSRARLKEAMLDDGFLRGIHKTAGGETMFYNRAGYNFPSHRQHHQRYIVIHETMHAFHMALNGHSTWAPNWITEGMADSIASHVYDPIQKQLTVMVFDRAPMNYITTGLKQYHQGNAPSIEQINDDPALQRGLNFFIIHFLMNDPMRQLYFKRYLQQLMALNPHSDNTLPVANKLLKTIFPNWSLLEQQFAQFVENIQPTFDIVSGPWEQDGNAYWLRSDDGDTLHQLDISPNLEAQHKVLDFPKPKLPNVLSAKDWLVAATTEFELSQLHRGEIGVMLSTSDNASLAVKLVTGNRVELDLTKLGFDTQTLAIRPKIVNLIKQNAALTFSLKQHESQLQLMLYINNEHQTMRFHLPNTVKLKDNAFSLIGRGMNHKITPYIQAHTFELPNLAQNNPDPWYFSNTALFVHLLNLCEESQDILIGCRSRLTVLANKLKTPAAHKELKKQLHMLNTQWQAKIPKSTAFLLPKTNYDSANDGVRIKVNVEHGLEITLSGPYSGKTAGTLTVSFYSFDDSEQSQTLWSQSISIKPNEQKHWKPNIPIESKLSNGIILINATMDVDGEPLTLVETLDK